MTFPFLAGTEPNFFNFGKVTTEKQKKEALILVIRNGRIRKMGLGWIGFFPKEENESGESEIHKHTGGENEAQMREGAQRRQILETETNSRKDFIGTKQNRNQIFH